MGILVGYLGCKSKSAIPIYPKSRCKKLYEQLETNPCFNLDFTLKFANGFFAYQ